jgi:hypothetical protein
MIRACFCNLDHLHSNPLYDSALLVITEPEALEISKQLVD